MVTGDKKHYLDHRKLIALSLMVVATTGALINRKDIFTIAALIAAYLLGNLRKKAGVLSDERTEKVSTKAAYIVLFANIIILFFAGNLLLLFGTAQPEAKIAGDTIGIIVSLLILTYLAMYYYYNQRIR
jgi:uncharacterized membrane protein